MVSVSPRLRDSLEYDEPEAIDPRFTLGFRSISLDSAGFEEYEDHLDDHRPYSAHSDPSAARRKRRQRNSDANLDHLQPFEYRTVADGDLFRLAVILPGIDTEPIQCSLIWESSNEPKRDYICLSYCWETVDREAEIICDGFRLAVTKNLLNALRNVRNRTANVLIWIDQICINQDDHLERGHQVSIMKKIFRSAKEVDVWLGPEDDKITKLFEYAKKMGRGYENQKRSLKRILNPRQLQDAIQRLLQKPWFQRVWVIPEVVLSKFTVVGCGRSWISWDNLVRLIKDIEFPEAPGFDKQVALLGNPRQRIAIINQMSVSQRAGLYHTDITQLLILAKSSRATDVRDMIYSFYGLTLLTTFPDYTRTVESLYADIIQYYVNSIQWEESYSTWHELTEEQRNQQLMSILYSAGSLQQHYSLPSWIPDWTFSWHLAPIWIKPSTNIINASGKDQWTTGVRCDFRAGGNERQTFDVIEGAYGMHHLRLSIIIFDSIETVNEPTPSSTPRTSEFNFKSIDVVDSPTLKYGRTHFQTAHGYIGIATPGIEKRDELAVVLGGDVPIILRDCGVHDGDKRAYKLLCECYIQDDAIMRGELVRVERAAAQDIVLI